MICVSLFVAYHDSQTTDKYLNPLTVQVPGITPHAGGDQVSTACGQGPPVTARSMLEVPPEEVTSGRSLMLECSSEATHLMEIISPPYPGRNRPSLVPIP